MAAVNKLHELYNEIKTMDASEFYEMISEAENNEERAFFLMAMDIILQHDKLAEIKEKRAW